MNTQKATLPLEWFWDKNLIVPGEVPRIFIIELLEKCPKKCWNCPHYDTDTFRCSWTICLKTKKGKAEYKKSIENERKKKKESEDYLPF